MNIIHLGLIFGMLSFYLQSYVFKTKNRPFPYLSNFCFTFISFPLGQGAHRCPHRECEEQCSPVPRPHPLRVCRIKWNEICFLSNPFNSYYYEPTQKERTKITSIKCESRDKYTKGLHPLRILFPVFKSVV